MKNEPYTHWKPKKSKKNVHFTKTSKKYNKKANGRNFRQEKYKILEDFEAISAEKYRAKLTDLELEKIEEEKRKKKEAWKWQIDRQLEMLAMKGKEIILYEKK